MSMWFTAKARRSVAAVAAAAGLALCAAGCGGDGDEKNPQASASASQESGPAPDTQTAATGEPLAEVKGSSGLLLRITSAERDAGGFITVNGELKNDGGESVTVPSALSGNETEIVRNGRSLGGATLVDPKGKKRYYVLRDTDGRPLTTTGFTTIKSGDTLAVFMQFPAPPSGTTELTFQLPTFASATLSVSG
ncbi:hypothetical protein AB0E75_02495 [Streptomyces griseoviridis]|jgi:hypothetical protein|uniref:Secreted protein n=1 Tax=Streptomyces griseoviridis TaxID=45398 RepID=A0A918G9K2_STRGD|nr:hypothetical protein [Streptomyces niveoruber]GGS25775.1 hypothetical protein GCM10010238_12600 [Streptomyces niveoruber]